MVSGAGLHVTEHHVDATGLPVVIVHGAPDRSKNFAAVIDLLPDLRIISYDRRGYGKSLDVLPPARDFADHADDLIEVLAGHQAVVVAQSVGCNVAMTAAARAPHLFAALGVWEPPNAWCDWWPTPELARSAARYAASDDARALGEAFNRGILGDDRWISLPERTKEMLRNEGAAFRTDMAAELEAPYNLADIVTPTVIGYGTATGLGHAEGARRLASLLGAELFEVEGADHFAPLSAPHAWATLVRKAVGLAPRDTS